MALNKPKLITDLTTLYDATLDNGELSPAEAKTKFIQELANAIEAYVKSATVKYNSGLTAPNGAVTGTFNGGLE
ncbi:hypothetical protein [Pedobacter sp. SL55]|uniref:hypothetical protein n=1 Tax=Pedobacter sp. SL55 TaxID=2995161 RepID=UPI002271740B|nr:hypothetical protein [Pedobacter sp. SL55]WAC40589.1 hypothetical protein OVA16_18790 [Pedobacter sp. SL55]